MHEYDVPLTNQEINFNPCLLSERRLRRHGAHECAELDAASWSQSCRAIHEQKFGQNRKAASEELHDMSAENAIPAGSLPPRFMTGKSPIK